MVTGPDNLVNRLGIVGVTVNETICKRDRRDLRIPERSAGGGAHATSTLLGEGPQPGDIIHAINGTPIKNLQQLKQQLRQIKPGNPIVLQVERSGCFSYLVLELEIDSCRRTKPPHPCPKPATGRGLKPAPVAS